MKKALIVLSFLLPLPLVAQPNGTTGGCVAVAVNADGGGYASSFSATKVLDLGFSIFFTPGSVNRFAGTRRVEFRIITPRGHLYQSMTIPFSADAGAKGQKVHVDGYRDPQDVVLLADATYLNNKHLRVGVTLPVAGTPIVTNSLYGDWRAEAVVDDEPLPCAQPALFTITQ